MGRGNFVTGSEERALSNESALLRAHGRISGLVADAFALSRVERLDFARGFSVVAFMIFRIMEGTARRKSSLLKYQWCAANIFCAGVVQKYKGDLIVPSIASDESTN